MKANSFLNKLTENLPIKIICFVVAILLYLFYQLTLIEKQILVIPLSVEQSGGVVLKETVQSSVKVYVRTKNTTQVHSDEVKACLNIDYITETGAYAIPVTLSVSDELRSIDPLEIKVKPESVKVKVERKISSAAYVNVRTIGEVKHGYKICEMSVEPELVQFSGAESVVKSIKSFDTEVISLADISSDKEFLVRLQNPNRKVTVQNEPTYIVKVKVEPEISEKTVSYVKPVIQNLSENFEVNSSFETISFRLSGPVLSV